MRFRKARATHSARKTPSLRRIELKDAVPCRSQVGSGHGWSQYGTPKTHSTHPISGLCAELLCNLSYTENLWRAEGGAMPWAELKFWGANGRACPKAEPGRLPRVGIVFVLIIIDYLYNNKRMLL